MYIKHCSKCGRDLPETSYYKESKAIDGLQHYCIDCVRAYRGYTPMAQSTNSASYLGVHVAEGMFHKRYPQATRMPIGNYKYDFLCPNGDTIDVKSSTLRSNGVWYFTIGHNTTPDWFYCVAFNNRTELKVQHVWMVPQEVIGNVNGVPVCTGCLSLSKWKQYELEVGTCSLGSLC